MYHASWDIEGQGFAIALQVPLIGPPKIQPGQQRCHQKVSKSESFRLEKRMHFINPIHLVVDQQYSERFQFQGEKQNTSDFFSLKMREEEPRIGYSEPRGGGQWLVSSSIRKDSKAPNSSDFGMRMA